jgi:GDP-4-dehydro-6-deoxy-D-mannose reductase
MRPVGAYGRSKVLQEAVALRYATMADLRVVCVRPFNYVGPGQSDHFVVSRIARQIALAERSPGDGVIELGSMQAVRDFTDVRDMVEAFIRALLFGASGAVYNIGSGQGHSIGLVASKLAAMATKPVAVRSVPGRVRRSDVEITTCDASLLRRDTDWVRSLPLDQTLADTLTYWRARTAAEMQSPELFHQSFPQARSVS